MEKINRNTEKSWSYDFMCTWILMNQRCFYGSCNIHHCEKLCFVFYDVMIVFFSVVDILNHCTIRQHNSINKNKNVTFCSVIFKLILHIYCLEGTFDKTIPKKYMQYSHIYLLESVVTVTVEVCVDMKSGSLSNSEY